MNIKFFLKILLFVLLSPFVLFIWYKMMIFLFPSVFIRPPYFEYSMGEIFKEVSLEEAKSQVDFDVYEPKYVPAGMPPYKVAIRIKPESETPEIDFYTPEFPGAKAGPPPIKGIRIGETSLPQKESSETEKRKLFIKNIPVEVESSNINDYLGISFKIKDTNLWIGSLGNTASETELVKIAESMIPE